MSEAIGLGGTGAITRDRRLTLFGQTMAYVAATAGLFALGAYAGRNLSESLGWVWFIGAIVCLLAMNFTSRRSVSATVRPSRCVRRSDGPGHGAPARLLRRY